MFCGFVYDVMFIDSSAFSAMTGRPDFVFGKERTFRFLPKDRGAWWDTTTMASHAAAGNVSESDNFHVFDDFGDVYPTINEIGCEDDFDKCEGCGEFVYMDAVSCKNDSKLWHMECAGFNSDDENDDICNNWECPNCCNSRIKDTGASTQLSSDSPAKKRKHGQDQIEMDKQPKKKNPVMRPASRYTCADALENAVRYFLMVLVSVKEHSIYSNQRYKNCKPLQELVSNITVCSNQPAFVTFSQEFVREVWDVISTTDKKQLSAHSYDLLLRKLHEYRFKVRTSWDNFIQQLNICLPAEKTVSDVLLQYSVRKLCELLLKEKNNKDLPTSQSGTKTSLRTEDHQVINYISGFIPFALIKRFGQMKTPTAKKYIDILKSWKFNQSDSDSFVGYVKEWLEKQSRGYLFQPCWNLHVFFRTLEYVGRQYLTATCIRNYKNTSLYKLLLDEFTKNDVVLNRWEVLMKENELDNDAKNKLFCILLKYWIKIRCNAYVKVYIDIRKAKDKKVSRKSEKALRKQVDGTN